MFRCVWFLIFIGLWLYPEIFASAQTVLPTGTLTREPAGVSIQSPQAGQALQGTVAIAGYLPAEGFRSAQLSFTYSGDPRDTWFLIREFTEPVPNGKLAEWDTTTLTDGEYTLRLVVILGDDQQVVTTIPQLRVRNYSSIETDTPFPTVTPAPGDTPAPTTTPTQTTTPIPATPTPLPPNPAELTLEDIGLSLGKGVLVAVGLFALLGLYQVARSVIKK